MNYPSIVVELSNDIKEIEIIPIGDVHFGSPEFNSKLFDETIDKVKTQENLYCILLGDLIECVTKDSVGDLFTQEGTPQTQANAIIEKLKPIKHKILGMTSGNHENRVFKSTGFDISYYIADRLEILDRYNKSSFILFIKFGIYRGNIKKKHSFSVVISHGVASSNKKAGKLNALLKMSEVVSGADVYIMGHVHDFICTYEENFIVDPQNKLVKCKVSCLLTQGAFLDFGGYGYEKGYKPLAQKYGIVTLGYIVKHRNDERYVKVRS